MTKKEQGYRELRGHLRGRGLRPGERMREIPLSEKLGISRIPLREAIDQLASEGLVERVPGLGSFVRAASARDLREIYEMREGLECFTVEKAAYTMSGPPLRRLGDPCREIPPALPDYRKGGK